MRPRIKKIFALLACLSLSVPLSALVTNSVSAADVRTVLSDGFEDGFPGKWKVGDLDEGSDQDYWGTTQYTYTSYSHAAYCAAVGDNSQHGDMPNVDITGVGGSFWAAPNDFTLRYDTSMSAYMARELDLEDGLTGLTLTFRYWTETGTGDHLEVSATTSDARDPNVSDHAPLWKQPSADSSGWAQATVSLPEGTTWISFNFYSGPTAPDDEEHIGAFVDDVVVEASEQMDLVSSITGLPSSSNQTAVSFTVTVTGDVDYGTRVEIYYRTSGTGDFQLYTTYNNPLGRWPVGIITFQAKGSGQYELFSRAYNGLWDQEPMKAVADATVWVDATPPVASHTLTGTTTSGGWYSSEVWAYINATDDSSGVRYIMYRWDSSAWAQYRGPVVMEYEGDHVLQYYAIDNAGNSQAVRTVSGIHLDRLGPAVTFEATQGCNFPYGDIIIGFELSDQSSGVSYIGYSVDGGKMVQISKAARQITLAGLDNGTHSIVLTVKDSAGNPSQTLLQFTVGEAEEEDTVVGTALVVAMLAVVAFPIAGAAVMVSRRKH